MKYILLAVSIILILISTNLITFGTTLRVSDYLWQKYHDESIQKVFIAVHRSCMKSLNDNNTCNIAAKSIYRQYENRYKALPGFDWQYITEPIDSSYR